MKDQKEEVPFAHYQQRFAQADPVAMAERTGIRWDGIEFYVNLLDRSYAISHPVYGIRTGEDGVAPIRTVETFLLRYLLEGQAIPWMGTWKTFRELPWGDVYLKPYNGRVLGRAAATFGRDLEAFRRAAEALGGTEIPHGDAGYEFLLIGDHRIRLLVWEGDEEFPPNAQMLYSDNFCHGFSAEDRVVAGDILISALKKAMTTGTGPHA